MKKTLMIAGSSLLLASVALADSDIEDLAPKNSVLVMSVSNAEESIGRLKETRLWDLWNAEELSEFREGFMDGFNESIQEMFAQLDLDQEELTMPTGPLGMALFPAMDMELGQMQLGMLMLSDYGDGADEQSEFLAAVIQQGEEEGQIEVEERDILGHAVTSITTITEEEPDAGMDEFGGMPVPGMDMVEGMASGFETMHTVRVGTQFLVGNDLPTLTAAIEALEDGGAESIKDNDTYQRVRDRLEDDADGYAVLLTGGAGELISGMAAGQQGGMNPMAMLAPQLTAVVGDIQGFGMDFRIAGETGMVEQHGTIYMPGGKRGLTEMLTKAGPRGDLPPFAGADAITFSSMAVQMDRFHDVITNIINTTMLGMMVAQQRDEIDAMLEQISTTMGNEAFMMTTLRRPISMETIGNVMAVRLKDEQGFEDLIAEGSQGMLEPRDFLGRRIYDLDAAGMGMPMGGGAGAVSMGIGGGFLIVGQTNGVEDAIRALGDAGNAGLAGRETYQRAVAALSGDPVVGWGYSEVVDAMEVQMEMQKQAQMQQIEMIREFDPDFAREMEQEMETQNQMMGQIDFDLLRQYIGPSAWEMTVDDEGFQIRAVTLAADGE